MADNKYFVLDHGYIKLLEHWGSDQGIVQAARQSTATESRSVEEDRKLIRHLLSGDYECKRPHSSPFQQAGMRFEAQLPLFVLNQWRRHRTWAWVSENEMSGRYTEMPDLYYVPSPEDMKEQSKSNKQGSADGNIKEPEEARLAIEQNNQTCRGVYKQLLDQNLTRERSCLVLPLSQYTRVVFSVDTWNLMHFLDLREDAHAQKEIRVYAEAIHEVFARYYPLTAEAFVDYVQEVVVFSRLEKEALREAFSTLKIALPGATEKMSKREVARFKEKLGRIGVNLLDETR